MRRVEREREREKKESDGKKVEWEE